MINYVLRGCAQRTKMIKGFFLIVTPTSLKMRKKFFELFIICGRFG